MGLGQGRKFSESQKKGLTGQTRDFSVFLKGLNEENVKCNYLCNTVLLQYILEKHPETIMRFYGLLSDALPEEYKTSNLVLRLLCYVAHQLVFIFAFHILRPQPKPCLPKNVYLLHGR